MKTFLAITTLILILIGGIFLASNRFALEGVLGISTHTQITPEPTETPTPTPTPIQEPEQQTTQVQTAPLVNCIGPDKKHLQVTQKQCDDFNAAWGKSTNTNNGIQCEILPGQNIQTKDSAQCNQTRSSFFSQTSGSTTGPTVSCVLSWGTYQISQSECDQEKAIDAQSQNIKNIQYSYPAYSSPTPIPSIDYSYQNSTCKQNALNTFLAAQQYANSTYGGGSSTGPAIIQIAQQQYNQAVAQCDSQYPVH